VNKKLSRRTWFGLAGANAAPALVACGSPKSTIATTTATAAATAESTTTATPGPVITNPDVALKQLQDGNQRFASGQMQHPDQNPQRRLQLSKTQQPFAVILTCSDSRVPPELVFDQGLGDLFVARVAGNVVDPTVLGSVEYAVVHSVSGVSNLTCCIRTGCSLAVPSVRERWVIGMRYGAWPCSGASG
jgi:carbonic anhydrase